MPKTLTQEDFINKVKDIYNEEYTVVGKYINSNTKLEIRHNKCNNVWFPIPYNFLAKKSKCPYCAGLKKLTQEDFIKKVNELGNNEYEVLSEIKNIDTYCKFRHKICGTEFKQTPKYFFKGNSRCPLCKPGKTNKLTKELLEKRISNLGNNEYELVGDYINIDKPVKMKHLKCNNIYEVTINNFSHGERCPLCKIKSKGEEKIKEYLEERNIKYISEKRFKDCKYKRVLPFDFFIEDLNICIEYDGEQHFKRSFYKKENKIELQKIKDNIKNEFCKNNGIKLIRIPYWEFNNIEEILDNSISRKE